MTRPLLTILLAMLVTALAAPRQVSAGNPPAPADRKPPLLGELIVIGTQADENSHASSLHEHDIAHRRASTSDSASLLRGIPGVSVYGAGAISGLPAVHGLADDRLRTQVDGMDLASACPNHMNPALSFIDPGKIAAIRVFAGIAPVSVGGDSIGGTIQVESAPPKFAGDDERWLAEGRAGFFSRSNDNAHGRDFALTLAGRLLSLSLTGSDSQADNYRAAGDFKKPGAWQTFSGGRRIDSREVAASEYRDARNIEFGLAVRPLEDHLVEFRIGRQQLDYEGFPNQRMDMVSSLPDPLDPLSYSLDKHKPANVNRLASVRYSGQYGWGTLEAQLSRQRLHHHMDLLPERYFYMLMPMDADAKTDGGKIAAHIGLGAADVVRIGYEFQNYQLNDWWPPINAGVSMCCNDFRNIHDGHRDRSGLFVEWERQWSAAWLGLLGIRGESVSAGTGEVQGYSAGYAGDASRFNAGSRSRRDRHLDWTALARYTPDAHQAYEVGIARKMRSPSLYERYAWSYNTMAALMNNFVGDGNGYIGNPELQPETAHTLSISGDWHEAGTGNWQIKVTGYLTYVHDFIDAVRCTPAMNTQCTAMNATTSDSYVKLRYVNQSARLYGADLAGETALGSIPGIGSFTLSGMMSYVRGKNRSTGDDLYHLMPLDTRLALVHRRGGWSGRLEVESVAAKTRVSQVRNEAATPAYTLLNLHGSYVWKHARLDVALDNALDKFYLQPLGGAYLGQGNPMTIGGIPWGMVVPGRGRSFNVALSVNF